MRIWEQIKGWTATNAKHRRMFFEQMRLISWQKARYDKLRDQHEAFRAEADAVLSECFERIDDPLLHERIMPLLMDEPGIRPPIKGDVPLTAKG